MFFPAVERENHIRTVDLYDVHTYVDNRTYLVITSVMHEN